MLATDAIDPAAVERRKSIATALAAMKSDLPDLYKLEQATANPSGPEVNPSSIAAEDWSPAPAQQFLIKDGAKLTLLQRIADSGAIAGTTSDPIASAHRSGPSIEVFERDLSWCARVLAKHGDHASATRLLILAISLADRSYQSATADVMTNLLAVAGESIALKAIDRVAQTNRLTPAEYQMLLAVLTPAPTGDANLSKALRGDFQTVFLRLLIDGAQSPRKLKGDDAPGTFDPVETAEFQAQITLIAMNNVRRPLSEYDPSGDQIAKRQGDGVPPLVSGDDSDEPAAPSPSWWDKLKTRYVMDSGHNTIGRQMIGGMSMADDLVKSSCRWRALREAGRVLLAAKIYAAQHGGQLPSDTRGFVSILGAWPTDPFNGKPMLYNAKLGVVYSVGPNLIDDGGRVDGNDAPDVGVVLRGP